MGAGARRPAWLRVVVTRLHKLRDVPEIERLLERLEEPREGM